VGARAQPSSPTSSTGSHRRRPAEVLEDEGELLGGDRDDDPLPAVQVGQGLELLDDVGAGRGLVRPDQTRAGRLSHARDRVTGSLDGHEQERGGTVQGHASKVTCGRCHAVRASGIPRSGVG
jgi:hypothetical protein